MSYLTYFRTRRELCDQLVAEMQEDETDEEV